MGTSFFHECNFQGLVEKVRERGRASTNQRMSEQFNRLFSTSESEINVSNPDDMFSNSFLESTPLMNGDVPNLHSDSNENNKDLNNEDDPVGKSKTNKKTDNCEQTNQNNSGSISKVIKDKDVVIDEEICKTKVICKNRDKLSNKSYYDNKSCIDQNNISSDLCKNEIISNSNMLSENIANLGLSSTTHGNKITKQDGIRSKGGIDSLKHKRMSETDMMSHDKGSDSRLKDSKSCNDLKTSTTMPSLGSISADENNLKTSHMCAQLCSLMKVQLLKTYEEVVCRYGGHFDMSLMLACQVKNYLLL